MVPTAAATDVAIQKKIFGPGTTTLIISWINEPWIKFNGEINDIMKIVKYLKKSGLLIKRVSETIKNEAKEQEYTAWKVSLFRVSLVRIFLPPDWIQRFPQ